MQGEVHMSKENADKLKEYPNIKNALERMMNSGRLMLTGKELVALGLVGSEQTLRNYRWKGEFIRYYRIHRSIRYSIPDIIKYLNENKVEPRTKL
jgi:hypothetical protein